MQNHMVISVIFFFVQPNTTATSQSPVKQNHTSPRDARQNSDKQNHTSPHVDAKQNRDKQNHTSPWSDKPDCTTLRSDKQNHTTSENANVEVFMNKL